MQDTQSNKAEPMLGKFRKSFVDELKQEHRLDEVLHLVNPETGHEVLCRPVEEPEYLRFQDSLDSRGTRSLATQKLVRAVLLKHDPGHPDVDHMFKRFPGLAEGFADELLRKAGFSKRTEGKVV